MKKVKSFLSLSKLPRIIGVAIIALSTWTIIYLSRPRSVVHNLPIVVDSLTGYSPSFMSTTEMSATLNATGWTHLKLMLTKSTWHVKLPPTSRNRRNHKIKFDESIKTFLHVNKMVEKKDISIESITPKSMHISLSRSTTRKVPVKLVSYQLNINNGYMLSTPINIEPDSLVLKGAASILKNITNWEVEVPPSVTLKSKFYHQLPVKNKYYPLVSTSSSTITISGYVEPITDIIIGLVPVSIENVHKDEKAFLSPEKISVVLIGPPSILGEITSDSISATVSYYDLISDKTGSVTPHVKHPKLTKIKNIIPKRLQYSLQY